MGACLPSRSSKNPPIARQQKVVTTQRMDTPQTSRLSGNFSTDEEYFRKHIDVVSNRKRLNLSNLSLIDSDIEQLMRCGWLDDIDELGLENNYITTDGLRLLTERKWLRLRVLNLAVNNIEEIDDLGQFPAMEICYLQRNPLSEESKRLLSELNGKRGLFLCWTE